MKWNGTVSQVGTSHIATTLASAKAPQATSSQANRRRGHSQRGDVLSHHRSGIPCRGLS
jgi:hypothetical protein